MPPFLPPGKASLAVTGKGKITVLQRLVEAYAAGAVNTKILMDDTDVCRLPTCSPSRRPGKTTRGQGEANTRMAVEPADPRRLIDDDVDDRDGRSRT